MSEATIDTKMYDGRADASNQQATAIANVAAGWHGGQGLNDIDGSTRSFLSDAGSKITAAVAALRASQEEAKSHLANLDLHPDGREARAKSARADGRESANTSLSDAETSLHVADALLFAESAPQWDESTTARNGQMSRARDDARMVLDGAKDVGVAVQSLAGSDSLISTLVTDGEWLDLYLMGKGIDPGRRTVIVNAAKVAAIKARAGRGNPAAILHSRLGKLRGAIGATKTLSESRV